MVTGEGQHLSPLHLIPGPRSHVNDENPGMIRMGFQLHGLYISIDYLYKINTHLMKGEKSEKIIIIDFVAHMIPLFETKTETIRYSR